MIGYITLQSVEQQCYFLSVCVCLRVITVCCSVATDPLSMSPQKALETIGANLQKQYENWQPRVSEFMFPSPSLFCYTVLLQHACAEYNRCILHKEFAQTIPLIKPHKMIFSNCTFATYCFSLIWQAVRCAGCYTSRVKDFLKALQGTLQKWSALPLPSGMFSSSTKTFWV